LASLCSYDFLFVRSHVPPVFFQVTVVIYEISFSMAFLVTIVVTFVLIPFGKAKGAPIDVFFKVPALIMHNMNVIFMVIETITSKLTFHSMHLPYVILFGCSYVVFSWIWYQIKGVFYYFFLDYEREKAVLFHIGLITMVSKTC